MKELLTSLLRPRVQELHDCQNHLVSPLCKHPINASSHVHTATRDTSTTPNDATSLRIVVSHFPTTLATMASLAGGYKLDRGVDYLAPLDQWRIWATAFGLPVLWHTRHSSKVGVPLPQALAVLYKISLGFLETIAGIVLYLREDQARAALCSESGFSAFLQRWPLAVIRVF